MDDEFAKCFETLKPDHSAQSLPLVRRREILNYIPDPRNNILPAGILTKGEPCGLIGAPSVGKSRLAIQLAISTTLGIPFLGWPTNGKGLKWLFLQTENGMSRLHHDFSRMLHGLGDPDPDLIEESIAFLNTENMDFASICMTSTSRVRPRILATLMDYAPDVVVIDPMRDTSTSDLNADVGMTEACLSINETLRQSNPNRTPLIVHHGRTGAAEASKVFGNDAGSFARNSKVLYGWLRSQINVAAAGVDDPDTIIVGCGKCSNGPAWAPFAASLNRCTMLYEVDEEFSLQAWAEKMANGKRTGKSVTPADLANLIKHKGGSILASRDNAEGIFALIRREFCYGRDRATDLIHEALEQGLIEEKTEKPAGDKGGRPTVHYVAL